MSKQHPKLHKTLFILAFCLLLNLAVGWGWWILSQAQPQLDLWNNDYAPRWVLGMVLGASLAVAGLLLQSVTQNPLAEPELLGVNQGATLCIVFGFWLNPEGSSSQIFWLALFGSLFTTLTVYIAGRRAHLSLHRLLLGGVALAFLFGSITTTILILNHSDLYEILYWLSGKLSGSNWSDCQLLFWVNLPLLALILALSQKLNLLALGEEIATNLGQNVTALHTLFVLSAALLCAISVSLAGPIGFIGLMAPHLAKASQQHNYFFLTPLSIAIGSTLLASSDLLAHQLFHPVETPVGILTALLGAPFFLYLSKGGTR